MAKHQIIYTSCMRGIDGVNDGQQVFSYDKGFTDSKSDAVKSLFTFQIPALEPGQVMTEELAKTMPSAFSYRYIGNGKCASTLNTYLGRDYMGSAGRFGNHLSHSIVCDFQDYNVYPCELYGGTSLRDHMEYEEVNNPNPPEYLPVPELEKGYVADIDSVIDFLGDDENMDYFKKMFIAMVAFKTDKKRVIICDQPENIIKWIAALHYTLPLEIAKKVNFTTYEYDPELSSSQICGVVSNGTRYNCQSYIQSGRHFVFDFINNQFSNIEILDEALIDFVDTSMSFSYDSLSDYFEFVINHTDYRELDEAYYSCYLLYSIFSDGFDEISLDQFRKLSGFVDEHLNEAEKKRFLSLLVDSKDTINGLNNEYALEVLGYLLKYSGILLPDQMHTVKQMVVSRITYSLSDGSITEEEFGKIYETVDTIARNQQVSIPAELMNDDNRNSLLSVISGQSVAEWKIYSIIRIMSDYVKDKRMPAEQLAPDHEIGKLYQGIFTAVYSTSNRSGQELIGKIFTCFKDSSMYLTNMALNIEGYLRDIPDGEKAFGYLWDSYDKYAENFDQQSADEATAIFADAERYDLIFNGFKARIANAHSFTEAYSIMRDAAESKFRKYPEYAKYSGDIFESYYKKYEAEVKNFSEEDALRYAKELVNYSIKFKVEKEYVDALTMALAEFIPYGKMNIDDVTLIKEIVNYQRNVRNKDVEGRCLLLIIGIYFDKLINKKSLTQIASDVMYLSGNKPADLKADDKTIEKYFEWIMPNITKFPLEAADYKQIYGLFNMSKEAQNEFMSVCCKDSFKKSKNGKDYLDFSEFLLFMFEDGDRDDVDVVGKYLCKLNKQKLSELDERMKELFKGDKKALHNWGSVREVAESTNPLLNNLSGLFKKIKN